MSNLMEVGKRYPNLITPEGGLRFMFGDDGGSLLIKYKNLRHDEIEDLKRGEIQYKMFYYHGVIWMLWKFGRQPWVDSPYTVHLTEGVRRVETPQEGQGYVCVLYLFENTTGELKHMRMISFTTNFSKALKEAILDQKERDFDHAEYNKEVENTMKAYTTDQLVKMARVGGKIDARS